MSAPALLIDTSVFLFALGSGDPRQEQCLAVLRRANDGDLRLHASVEAIQEVAFHRMRRTDRATATAEARTCGRLCQLHPFDAEVLERSLTMIEENPSLRGRDAVHAATAAVHGLDAILSADTDFDGIPGLQRVDPAELAQ